MRSSPVPRSHPHGYLYGALSLALACAIAFAGYRSYVHEEIVFKDDLQRQLSQIAELKASQILDWEAERIGDVQVATSSALTIPAVLSCLGSCNNPGVQHEASKWADATRLAYRYTNVVLTDAAGNVRLNSGPLLGTAALYREAAKATIAGPDAIFANYYSQGGAVVLSHFVFGGSVKSPDGSVRGVVLLAVDPWTRPLPDIIRWPAPQQAGEVVVARTENGGTRILKGSGSPREMMVSSASSRMSSVAQALLSKTGFSDDGFDDHGERYVASAKRVVYEWFVVARVGADAAYAPLVRARSVTLLVVGLLIIMCGAGIGLVWRHQFGGLLPHPLRGRGRTCDSVRAITIH